MNDSFFYAFRKAKPVIHSIMKMMQPRLSEELGLETRLGQLTLWSLVCTPVSLLVTQISLYLTTSDGTAAIAVIFWSIVGICSSSINIISTFSFLFSFFGLFLYSVYKTTKTGK